MLKFTWLVAVPFAVLLVVALGTLATGCTIGRPYRVVAAPADASEKVLVAVTHVVIDNDKRGSFDDHIERVVEMMQTDKIPGLVGYTVRKEFFGDQAWTMSVWTDAMAMRRFVATPQHRQAVADTRHAIVELRMHRFEVEAGALPVAWDEALSRFEQHHSAL